MAVNRGKQFELIIKEAFEKVNNVSVDRIHDQTTGYRGSFNICDFIVYKKPYEYYIECKSVHGNTLPLNNITDNQWNGLLEKSKIKGVRAGVICWWIDKDVTKFIPIQSLQVIRDVGFKSIRYDSDMVQGERLYKIEGVKKRVFFEYDMNKFFEEVER